MHLNEQITSGVNTYVCTIRGSCIGVAVEVMFRGDVGGTLAKAPLIVVETNLVTGHPGLRSSEWVPLTATNRAFLVAVP